MYMLSAGDTDWKEDMSQASELVNWAQVSYPFDDQHKYIIKKNSQGNFGQGEYIVPPESLYVIEIPNEPEAEMQHMTSGRKIGSTTVDLSKYEDKEVYIEGYHFLGKPMFLVDEITLPMFVRSVDQAVIHVQSIKTEDEIKRNEEILKSLNSPE